MGAAENFLPTIPGFQLFFFGTGTALICHAATFEPLSIEIDYLRFLYSITGGRIATVGRKHIDVWGLDSSNAFEMAMKRANIK